MLVVVMGVSGAGKSTVGQALAAALGWPFVEADELHPPANIAKMHRGIPLNDDDRRPLLDAIRHRLEEAFHRGENVVLACSALKHAYQEYLQHEEPERIHYVYLSGSEKLIRDVARASFVFDDLAPLPAFQPHREHLREKFADGTRLECGTSRRIMVAGEQTPEFSLDEDRD